MQVQIQRFIAFFHLQLNFGNLEISLDNFALMPNVLADC